MKHITQKNIFILSLFLVLLLPSCNRKTVIEREVIKYSDVIAMNKSEVRSIAGVSLDSKWGELSTILNINIAEMRNNVIKKSLVIENYNTRLVIFTDNNNIYQVSLMVEQTANEADIMIFFDEISKEIKKRTNVVPIENIIEEDDGSILEKNIIYNFERKTFFINIGRNYLSINIAGNNNLM